MLRPRNLGIAAVVLGGVLLALFAWRSRREPPPVPMSDSERLRGVHAALAAAEQLDVDRAAELWDDLCTSNPDDVDAQVNRALAKVMAVQATIRRETDLGSDEAVRRDASRLFPMRIGEAESAIAEADAAGADPSLVAWMASAVELARLRRARSRGQDVDADSAATLLDRLLLEIRSEPAIYLAGPLYDTAGLIEDPRSGLPEGTDERVAAAFATLSDAHPRNLFVALQTIRFWIDADDKSDADVVADVVRRTAALAEPLDALLRRATAPLGKSPQELAASLETALESGDWAVAKREFSLWQNVLVSTEMVRSDRKLADPIPLDLLRFETLHRLTRQVSGAEAPVAAANPLRFEPAPPLDRDLTGIESVESVAWIDFDLDDRLDLLVAGDGRLSLLATDNGTYRRESTADTIANVRGIAVVDLFMVDGGGPGRIRRAAGDAASTRAEAEPGESRHETFPCVVVYGEPGVELFRVDGRDDAERDRLLPPTEPTGLESIRDVTALVPGDWDADGDLDLAIATADQGLQLWINRGNMTFFPVTEHSQLPPPLPPVVSLAIADLDRDLDLDLITIDASGQLGWLENLLHLQFRWQPLELTTATVAAPLNESEPTNSPKSPPRIGPSAGARSTSPSGHHVAVAELDGNVSWDVVAARPGTVSATLSETTSAGAWDAVETRRSATGIDPIAFFLRDLDNDSWLDAIAATDDRVVVCRGGQAGELNPAEVLIEADGIRDVAIGDFDLDGRIDLCIADLSGVRVFRNVTETDGHFLAIRYKGIADNAQDSGRINHYAIGSTLEVRFGPHYRAAVVTERTTHFGIDGYERAETFRAVLPNGMTHVRADPPTDTVFTEAQTLKGSCPYLYAWDGERFAFVTDCLWAAPLGLQFAPGQVLPDRPWEYLKVAGDSVEPRDGHYEFRVTEELWEIAYFDLIELHVVDHPPDVEIWTNEKVGTSDVKTHELYTTGPTRPLRAATDSNGTDVTDRLSSRDGRYVQAFDRRLRQGLVPKHSIDLDLGDVGDAGQVLLLLTGWIFPTDTSLNLQIDQNPQLPAIEFPSLWVPDGAGGWEVAIEQMGFPGGKTKTIVVDVSDALRRDDPRVRVQTSSQICWDAAEVAVDPPEVGVRTRFATLAEATVAQHGFSRELPRDDSSPHRYDYDDVAKGPKWPPLSGGFSRLGDCRESLLRREDRLVVIGGGDEIRLRFRDPGPPPDGWKRDFLLHLVGWDKDADLNTLAGQSVGPLPFRSMERYPPPPSQAAELGRVERLNAPQLTRHQSFREFWKRTPAANRPTF